MRLDEFLIHQYNISKKERKQWLMQHKILIDGQPAHSLSQNIDASIQNIVIQDKVMQAPVHQYWMLYKPKGVLTAVSDDQYVTVVDLLSSEEDKSGVYPVGRLDRDTSGLLLLTNNGPLGFRMLHPKYHVSKTYYVEVNGEITDEIVELFQFGVIVDYRNRCNAAKLEVQKRGKKYSAALLTIDQGKYHQVKKMFLSVGLKVIELKRISFGPIVLDEQLSPGDYRKLTQEELSVLKPFFV